MRQIDRAHLESAMRKWSRDEELFREVQHKVQVPEPEHVAARAKSLGFATEELVDDKGALTRAGDRVLETIVQPTARPVLLIRDNRFTPEFLGPDSQVWAARLQNASAVLNRVIPSVGRVEVDNHPDYTWVGTGWVIDDGILVTNRHVAREFGRRDTRGFVFRTGLNDRLMSSSVDFLEEYESASSATFTVESVLWIAPADLPDVAFLRLRPDSRRPLPPALGIAEAAVADSFVATIGYPARDSRIPDQALVKRVFGDVYEKKRLAPGQVTEVRDDEIEHDCSTLGGNSGSPVVDLASGDVVGLHFSGLYLQANYAVAGKKVKELLRGLKAGDLVNGGTVVRMATTPVETPPTVPSAPSADHEYACRFCIPIEVVVRVGAPSAGSAPCASNATGAGAVITVPAGPAPATGVARTAVGRIAGEPTDSDLKRALATAREALAKSADVLDVRLGYRFKRGWITDEQVVVVEVRNKMAAPELRRAGKPLIPNEFVGVGVDVRTADLRTQLERLGVDLESLEGRGGPGAYVEPQNLSLDRVKARMHAIFHVSPDHGFPVLKDFLSRVRGRLTATMYEWDAAYISDAIVDAVGGPGRTLKMVTQKKTPAGGTEAAVEDMRQRIGANFEHVWASVNDGGLFASAYHIKVASRDGEEFWLSSGNWKSSNQPDIDPVGDHTTTISALRKYNRDWHAVIQNAALASTFQQYIEYDFDEAQRVPLQEGVAPAWPDLFVPEEAFLEALERPEVRYFEPLDIERDLDIQPLLTPDHDSRGRRLFIQHATDMVREARSRIFVQNQSFSLLDDDKNDPEFEQFFEALKKKQRDGVDVRIIFRDPREFSHGNEAPLQKQLEVIKRFGLDTDRVKVQRRLHTKAIIVDESQVMLGSHNLTNSGSLWNRDASLRVRDSAVTKYFADIFLYDWDVLAQQSADESIGDVRIAAKDEAAPPGFRRISVGEFLGLA